MFDPGPGADERACLEMVARCQTVVSGEPACADPPFARRGCPWIKRHWLLAQELHNGIRVIVEPSPDPRQIVHNLKPQIPQLGRRTDARQQQQLRRIDRPGGQQYLVSGMGLMNLTVLLVLDPNGALAVEQNAQRQRVCSHPHIAPSQRLAQITPRSTPATPGTRGAIYRPEGFLTIAIQVTAHAIPGFSTSREKRCTQGRLCIAGRDV
ncbi:hypothetical protein D3C86_1540850 [compost metagenome]